MTIPRSTTEELMHQTWSLTLDEIDALPDDGEALDREIDRMIRAAAARSGVLKDLGLLTHGMTREELRHELEVEAAIRLLGSAPLPPAARRAVFEWLAHADGARLDGTELDHLGRRGVGITFVSSYDRQVPARTVTDHQVIDELIAAGADPTELENVVTTGETFKVPTHRTARIRELSIIFDPESGELLQFGQWGSEVRGQEPQVIRPMDSRNHRAPTIELVGGGGGGGGTDIVWVERGRTTDTVSMEPACQVAHAPC